MDEKQKSEFGRVILILAAFGFALPLNFLFIAYIFIYYSAELNIQEYSKQIINIFSIYSLFYLSIPFILDKFGIKLKEKPLGIHFKWLTFGLYFSFLGTILSILHSDMNYAFAGILTSLAIASYVITYIKMPVKAYKNDTQLKVWAFIGTMNLFTGSVMICIPLFFSDMIEIEETIKPFFWSIIKYMGISTSGFGIGILYVLFILFRKRDGLEIFDE